MIAALFLIRDTWLDYCHRQPLPPLPMDKNAEHIATLSLCVTIGLVIFVSAVYYAIVRLRTATQEEFNAANDRLSANIQNLATFQGKELRRLCRAISYDIIQVTGFAEKRVSLCLHERDTTQMQRLIMIEFLWENKALRFDAVVIRFLYYLPFVWPIYSATKTIADKYSVGWTRLLQRFRFTNPQCNDL